MAKVNILFVPLDSAGHINACSAIAEHLQSLGHRVTFALERAWTGRLQAKGFEEAIYVDQSRDPNHGPNDYWADSVNLILDTLDKNSLYKAGHQNLQEFEDFIFSVLKIDDQLATIIEKVDPDVIVVDHYFSIPSVYKSGRKWVKMSSATALSCVPHPDTPPTSSGYPTLGDRAEWKLFEETSDKHYGPLVERFAKSIADLGLPPLPENSTCHLSPYLNIYPYPEELDYLDIRPLPDKFCRFDHFIRSQKMEAKKFEMPGKLQNLPGKLIYVSMGSMCSMDVRLMKRLVDILQHSPHRFLMVLGAHHDQIELPANIYGERSLPQLSILPQVDLFITHGGNNSVLESLYYGKPMIINPMFYDQYDNAQRVTEKGFGNRINLYHCKPQELLDMIESIISDQNIHRRLEAISKRMQNSNSTEMAAKAIVEVALNSK